MLTSAPSIGGLVGQDQQPQGHADVRAVTVTTINNSSTMYRSPIVTVSQARADQGSTTIGIGVINKYSLNSGVYESINSNVLHVMDIFINYSINFFSPSKVSRKQKYLTSTRIQGGSNVSLGLIAKTSVTLQRVVYKRKFLFYDINKRSGP